MTLFLAPASGMPYFQRMMIMKRFLLLMACGVLALTCKAQEALAPLPSPLAVVSLKYENSYIKIVYSRPQKRGRDIFGALVPYGQVWRLGANEATEITTTQDLYIGGNLLPAGTYSFFAIPQVDKWTMIINSDLGLWGAYNYNPEKDVMRFDVPVEAITDAVFEPFTMAFDEHNNTADLDISWDRTRVKVPVEFIEAH